MAGVQTNTFNSVTGYKRQVTVTECQVCIMHERLLTGTRVLRQEKVIVLSSLEGRNNWWHSEQDF